MKRLLLLAGLAVVAVLALTGAAYAYWSASSTAASASAAAASLGTPTVSTSGVTFANVTVAVTAAPLTGPAPSSYRVDRTGPGATVSGVCVITGATGSCNDSSPVQGQVNQYSVFARLGTSWVAATAATTSAAVPQADATPPVVPAPTIAANVRSGASISSAATDTGSGVASVTYYSCPGTSQCVSGGTLIGSSTTGPAYSVTWTSQPADGSYQVYATAVDNSGNSQTSSTSTSTKVDNTAPAVPAVAVAASSRNGATLSSSVTDSGSGVASVSYFSCPGTASCVSGGSLIGASSTGPSFTVTWTGQPADGSYQVYATGTDNAGNARTSSSSMTTLVDNTLPAIPAVSVGAFIQSGAVLSSAATDSGSGVASVAYFSCPGTVACVTGGSAIGSSSTGPSFSVTWSSMPADGSYQVYATATDAAGNAKTTTTSSSTVIDNSAPTFAVTTSGANVGGIGTTVYFRPGGTGSFTVTATDAQSGITSSSFPAAPTGFTRSTGTNSATYTLSGSPVAGSLSVSATNGATGSASQTITLTPYGSGGVGSAVDTTNAGTAGSIESGDTLVLTYSHAMRASSILAGWNGSAQTVTVKVTDTAGADVLTVSSPTVNLGSVSMGSTGWATADITWTDSTMRLSADGTQVTLTIGATCAASTGNCTSKLNAVGTSTQLTWTPSAGALDLAGNATSTAAKAGTSKVNF